MTTRFNEPITTWQKDDEVMGFVLVQKAEQRQDRNGRSYYDLVLADASGSIPAKIWSDSAASTGAYESGTFAKYHGVVKTYRDQLQLDIRQFRLVNDGDRGQGFDEELLIPSTPEDIDDLWRRLVRLFPAEIRHPLLRRLAEETIAVHGAALRTHPAAKGMHHAYRGGLLEHTVSMAELAEKIAGHYPELDRDLLLVGTLFHDLGKLFELGAMPKNDYTLAGRLVGHVVIGRDLVRERCAAIPDFPVELALHLEHLVLSHQGTREYGAAVEPMTEEALVLHFIDDLDSKINQFRNLRRDNPAEVQYLKGLARHVYLPARSGDPRSTVTAGPETDAEPTLF
jgi:3'-5' exoribonuclease